MLLHIPKLNFEKSEIKRRRDATRLIFYQVLHSNVSYFLLSSFVYSVVGGGLGTCACMCVRVCVRACVRALTAFGAARSFLTPPPPAAELYSHRCAVHRAPHRLVHNKVCLRNKGKNKKYSYPIGFAQI